MPAARCISRGENAPKLDFFVEKLPRCGCSNASRLMEPPGGARREGEARFHDDATKSRRSRGEISVTNYGYEIFVKKEMEE